jgi:hypothetical protein
MRRPKTCSERTGRAKRKRTRPESCRSTACAIGVRASNQTLPSLAWFTETKRGIFRGPRATLLSNGSGRATGVVTGACPSCSEELGQRPRSARGTRRSHRLLTTASTRIERPLRLHCSIHPAVLSPSWKGPWLPPPHPSLTVRYKGAARSIFLDRFASSRGIRRHEYEYCETLACVILYAVLFPGRRHDPLPWTEHLLL